MKNTNGFTYLEVVVSFVIFGLMLVIVIKTSTTIHQVIRYNQESNKMLHIAELEMENYKTGIMNVTNFINDTDFTVVAGATKDGVTYDQLLVDDSLDGIYTAYIMETSKSENVSLVIIEVSANNIEVDTVSITGHVIKDSE